MSDWFTNPSSEIPDEMWRAATPIQRQADAVVLWAELTGKHASGCGSHGPSKPKKKTVKKASAGPVPKITPERIAELESKMLGPAGFGPSTSEHLRRRARVEAERRRRLPKVVPEHIARTKMIGPAGFGPGHPKRRPVAKEKMLGPAGFGPSTSHHLRRKAKLEREVRSRLPKITPERIAEIESKRFGKTASVGSRLRGIAAGVRGALHSASNTRAGDVVRAAARNPEIAGSIASTGLGAGHGYLLNKKDKDGLSRSERAIIGDIASAKARGLKKEKIDKLERKLEKARLRKDNLRMAVARDSAIGAVGGALTGFAVRKYKGRGTK